MTAPAKMRALNSDEVEHRALAITPKSFKKEERTFEVTFSTGSRGIRRPWFEEPYHEELSMDLAHVRLGRANNGAPFLESHNGGGLENVLGVVKRAWIEGNEGRAIIQLSKRAAVEDIIQDIEDGILRNISVGYNVHAWEEKEKAEDGFRVFRAVDWEPFEISLVAMGFDDAAKIRSADIANPEKPAILEESTEEQDAEQTDEQPESDNVTEEQKAALEAEQKRLAKIETDKLLDMARKEERERGETIVTTARQLGLDAAFASKHVSDGTSLDSFRKLAIEEKARLEPTTSAVNSPSDATRNADLKLALRDATLHRAMPEKFKAEGEAKEFLGLSVLDGARIMLESGGVNTSRMSQLQLAERALSTSDFPELMSAVVNKSLRDSYVEAPQTFLPFVRQVKVKDFKQISRINLGDAPALEKVYEHGPVKAGTVNDTAEKYQVDTYAKKLAITRKVLINDDLDAMVRLPAKFGIAARDLESDLFWNLVITNPAMGDGFNLFDDTNHKNNVAGAAVISPTSVGVSWSKMRNQKGLNGRNINIAPRHLVIPVSLETVAMQFFANINPQVGTDVNPYKSILKGFVAEPRLDAASVTAWYLFSSVADIDMVEMATLQGSNGPVITTTQVSLAEGMQIECMHDVGVGLIDYRGFQKHA